MNGNTNLQDLLDGELGKILPVLEAERQRALHTIYPILGVVVFLVIVVLAAFMRITSGHISGFFFLIPSLVGIALCYWSGSNATRHYCLAYKHLVHGRLLKTLHDDLKYSATDSISPHEFEESQLFPRRHDRFRGEDLVEGCIGHTKLRFSEVHAEYKTQSRDNKDQWVTIFRGLFFVADFNKHFIGATVVVPDNTEPLLGKFVGHALQNFGARISSRRGELVKLESPEFERSFAVFSTDQIEARYILSTSLMNRILKFQGKSGRPLYVSFVRTKIYVAVPTSRNLFEPSVFRSALSTAPLDEYVNDLQLMTDLVDDLDLNTRIWSKQPTANTA